MDNQVSMFLRSRETSLLTAQSKRCGLPKTWAPPLSLTHCMRRHSRVHRISPMEPGAMRTAINMPMLMLRPCCDKFWSLTQGLIGWQILQNLRLVTVPDNAALTGVRVTAPSPCSRCTLFPENSKEPLNQKNVCKPGKELLFKKLRKSRQLA